MSGITWVLNEIWKLILTSAANKHIGHMKVHVQYSSHTDMDKHRNAETFEIKYLKNLDFCKHVKNLHPWLYVGLRME